MAEKISPPTRTQMVTRLTHPNGEIEVLRISESDLRDIFGVKCDLPNCPVCQPRAGYAGQWLERVQRRQDPERRAWLIARAKELDADRARRHAQQAMGTQARGEQGELLCESCIHGIHQECECGCDCNQDDFRGELELVKK